MKPELVWMGREKGQTLEYSIPQSGVAIAAISKTTSDSKITLIQGSSLGLFLDNPELFRKTLLSSLPNASSDFTLRIIGSTTCASSVSELLKNAGFDIGKPVILYRTSIIHFVPTEGRLRIPVGSNEKIKVLVVDDSETIRKILKSIVDGDPELHCVGTIEHPHKVEEAIKQLQPDVITMDIHMPEMTGVELVKRLIPKYKIPIIMISSISMQDGQDVFDALDAGAVDYIQKPSMKEIPLVTPQIREKIRIAASAKISAKKSKVAIKANPRAELNEIDLEYLIAIGSSTGGTEALREILTALPSKIPPVLIVQHIPAVFSKAFADRMNELCKFTVKEAEHAEPVLESHVYIAPGGKQMKVKAVKGIIEIVIEDSAPVNRHKPSIDFLFNSIADLGLKKVTAAILTGMGADGAKGLLKLKQQGAHTLAQDEQTSVVYGMPKEALKIGATEKVSPITEIASDLMQFCSRNQKRKTA